MKKVLFCFVLFLSLNVLGKEISLQAASGIGCWYEHGCLKDTFSKGLQFETDQGYLEINGEKLHLKDFVKDHFYIFSSNGEGGIYSMLIIDHKNNQYVYTKSSGSKWYHLGKKSFTSVAGKVFDK